MDKKGKIYIILLAVAILSIVLIEYTKPKEINWFPSYDKQHKIPYGTYIFKEQLHKIFGDDQIKDVNRPPFEYLSKPNNIKGTYLFINNNVNFGNEELEKLLNWTAKGNTLFIASSNFEKKLLDTLNLDTSVISNFNNINNEFQFQLKSSSLKDTTSYTFDKANFISHFNAIDTLYTKIVSITDHYKKGSIQKEHISTIKQQFGEGQIILSTFPQAFTNYFILNTPNQKFTSGLISYIDKNQPILFDNHYKSGKKFYSSPLYIMLNTKELKWAYYMMLLGALVYIIFEGKRKQRAIPIKKPLRNQTIDFTRTIANMYYEKDKHKELIQHKIHHFLDFIRVHFYLNTTLIDKEFIKNLAARSNNTIEDTQELFNTINKLNNQKEISNIELERLNTLIETFKSNNIWKTKI
ncbi:DUF4350 domain-containing protein [Flavobacteriaceae bacterium AU392]|nr:DUF4350 domain-containing protein [Flavobacteriaceae bacterium]RKM83631.1 DUF4350 domain-containing protein [Flavobacteriaceae bacterium AU392]